MVFLLAMPSFALALEPGQSGGGAFEEGLNQVQGQFPTSGSLSGSQTATDFILGAIRILLTVVMAVAILFLIIGGFKYITSGGNPAQAESGKKTLINAVIGMALIILSYVIVSVVNNTLSY